MKIINAKAWDVIFELKNNYIVGKAIKQKGKRKIEVPFVADSHGIRYKNDTLPQYITDTLPAIFDDILKYPSVYDCYKDAE